MTEGRTHTTLAGPRRCPWCGHRCHGRTCRNCTDLARIEAAMTREPKPKPAPPDFRYLPKTDPFYRPPGEAVQATKGKAG